jgi:hypothetical protein
MARLLYILCSLLLIAPVVVLASVPVANEGAYVIIVHPKNPVTSVDREFLRDAFMKKALYWSDGTSLRPATLSNRFPANARFTQDILNRSPKQLRAFWIQRIFSGTAVPPPELDSTAAAIAHVLRNLGGVAYLPAGIDAGGAKLIKAR